MKRTIWTYKTRNFTVECEEEEQRFIDPLVHDQIILDAVDLGTCHVARLIARVSWRSVEIGYSTLSDCIFEIANDSFTVIGDRSYLRKVVKSAIGDARGNLAQIERLPD